MINNSQYFKQGSELFALPSWKNAECIFNASTRKEIIYQTQKYNGTRVIGKVHKNIIRLKKVLLKNDLEVVANDFRIFNYVQDALNKEIIFVFLLRSRDRLYEKNTIAYMDGDFDILAYLKHSDTSKAINIIKNEKRMLEALPKGLGPSLLNEIQAGVGYGILISPVSGKKVSIHCEPKWLTKYLNRLPRKEAVDLESHPWIKDFLKGNTSFFDTLVKNINDTKWDIVCQHGDFAPWNLMMQKNHQIVAFDWECGTANGFPYYDFVYFYLQVECLIRRAKPLIAYRRIVANLVGELNSKVYSESIVKLVCLDMINRSCLEGGVNTFAEKWRKKLLECSLDG